MNLFFSFLFLLTVKLQFSVFFWQWHVSILHFLTIKLPIVFSGNGVSILCIFLLLNYGFFLFSGMVFQFSFLFWQKYCNLMIFQFSEFSGNIYLRACSYSWISVNTNILITLPFIHRNCTDIVSNCNNVHFWPSALYIFEWIFIITILGSWLLSITYRFLIVLAARSHVFRGSGTREI